MKSFTEGIESFGFIFIWVAFIIIAAIFNYFKKKAQLSKNNNRTNTDYGKNYAETYVEEDNAALENLKGILEQRDLETVEEIYTETKESINIKKDTSNTVAVDIVNHHSKKKSAARSYAENIDENYLSEIEDIKSVDEEGVVVDTKQVYRVSADEEMMKQAVVYDAILNPKRINYARTNIKRSNS